MLRVFAFALAGLSAAGCSSMSFNMFSSGPATQTLRIESEPSGAEARTSLGGACKTPCELPVATAAEFTVTFELSGYQPQTVPVALEGVATLGAGDSQVAPQEPTLSPNPVYAELSRAAPAVRRAPTRRANPPPRAAPAPPDNSPFPPVR